MSREELERIVQDYHHLQAEHRRAGEEGSVRRHLHARLAELEERFERLLGEWVAEDAERWSWRERLHRGGAAPAEPGRLREGLVFRGRSAGGSLLEVWQRPEGDYEFELDGKLARRGGERLDLAGHGPDAALQVGSAEFREVFTSSAAALEALAAFVAGEGDQPPWEHAAELVTDGLVDRHFGLTPRGRRALAVR